MVQAVRLFCSGVSGVESGRQGRADTLQVRPCKLAVVIRPPGMAEVPEMQEHFPALTTDGRPDPAGQTLYKLMYG